MSKISLVVLLFAVACLTNAKLHDDVEECKPGSPAMFKFMGANAVNIKEGQTATYETFCFKSNTASLKWKSSTVVEITIDANDKRDPLCTDNSVITSFLDYKLRSQFFSGRSVTTLTLSSPSDQAYVKNLGISIVPLCDRLMGMVPDIVESLVLFGDKILGFMPRWFLNKLRDDNVQKLDRMTGQKSVARKVKHTITYDWLVQNIKSGDVYCQYDQGGMGTTILWGTGGVCSHVGIFLWEQNKLYFVEMNPPEAHRFDAATYFPQIVADGTNNLSVMMLNDETRAKFDVNKAWKTYYEFVNSKVTYGFENIFFSFWDTPHESFTTISSAEILMTYVGMLEKIPQIRPLLYQYLGQGLNNRLGTTGLSFEQILLECANRNISIGELGAMPEKISYRYGNDKSRKIICSAFVIQVYMDAGVLSGYDLNPSEFTPSDICNMQIWRTDIPTECSDNDPYLPYCQLAGRNALLPFKWYNKVPLYSHMNEKCPGLAPIYDRPSGC
jgi:hypothetical protein